MFIVLFCLSIVWLCSYNFFKKLIIKESSYVLVKGVISSYHQRGIKTLPFYDYKFTYQGVRQKGSRSDFQPNIIDRDKDSIYIVVSEKYPSINFLLYYPEEFEEFGFSKPVRPIW